MCWRSFRSSCSSLRSPRSSRWCRTIRCSCASRSSSLLQRSAGVSAILAAGPCVAMGATFPFLGAYVVRSRGAGAATGQLLAVNTVAGVLGFVATGFALVPALGTQSTAFVLGLAVLVAGGRHPRPHPRCVGRPRRRRHARECLPGVRRIPTDQTVSLLFGDAEHLETVVEGAVTSVAVARYEENGAVLFKALRTPGVAMSNTAFGARRYMGMMAHVPMLLARDPSDVLLVCFGVGNTARSILSHPELEHLDIVDVSPEVLALSPRFAEVTGSDPLLDPRVTVRVDDGRHHLLTTDRRYDVITAEPPPPMNAGVVNLYTREYYEAAQRVLEPGGVAVQWLPAVSLTEGEDRADHRGVHGRVPPRGAVLRLPVPVVPRRLGPAALDRSGRLGGGRLGADGAREPRIDRRGRSGRSRRVVPRGPRQAPRDRRRPDPHRRSAGPPVPVGAGRHAAAGAGGPPGLAVRGPGPRRGRPLARTLRSIVACCHGALRAAPLGAPSRDGGPPPRPRCGALALARWGRRRTAGSARAPRGRRRTRPRSARLAPRSPDGSRRSFRARGARLLRSRLRQRVVPPPRGRGDARGPGDRVPAPCRRRADDWPARRRESRPRARPSRDDDAGVRRQRRF